MTNGNHNSEVKQPPKGGFVRLLQTVVLTSLLITGGLTVCRFGGLFETLEIAAYDTFMRLKPVDPLDDRLLVVGISEADIQSREEYPIREGTVLELIEALGQHEPSVIALDMALDFPQGTDEDRTQLAEVLADSDRIISACLMSSAQFPGVPPGPGVSDDLVAFADFPQDRDGIIRRSILVSTPGEVLVDEVARSHLCNEPGQELLSLSLLSALIYLEDEALYAEQTNAGDLAWENTVIRGLGQYSGGYANTGAVDYQVMLNYRAPRDAVRQVSLSEVLENRVDPEWIRDRIILVGYTSPVVGDISTTPYTETIVGFRGMPGVIIHAQATSQLISAVLDDRPLIQSWPEIGELLLIGTWSLMAGLLAFYTRHIIPLTIGVIASLAIVWGLCYVLFLQGVWLPVVPLTIVIVLTSGVVSIVSQARQNVYVQAIFEQLQAEIKGQLGKGRDSHRDRLDDLLQRARAIRRRQAIGDALDQNELDESVADPLHLQFDSPEVQTFYEQIKTELQQKFEAEKATLTQKQQPGASGKSARLKSLLKKSQRTRGAHPPPPPSKLGNPYD